VQPVAKYKVSTDIGRGKKQQLIADNSWSARNREREARRSTPDSEVILQQTFCKTLSADESLAANLPKQLPAITLTLN
jgi:hypothetical protein